MEPGARDRALDADGPKEELKKTRKLYAKGSRA